jgi:hypothetical protein
MTKMSKAQRIAEADRLARAEIAESETHTAVVKAAVDGGGSNAEIAQAYADHDRAAEALHDALCDGTGLVAKEWPPNAGQA